MIAPRGLHCIFLVGYPTGAVIVGSVAIIIAVLVFFSKETRSKGIEGVD